MSVRRVEENKFLDENVVHFSRGTFSLFLTYSDDSIMLERVECTNFLLYIFQSIWVSNISSIFKIVTYLLACKIVTHIYSDIHVYRIRIKWAQQLQRWRTSNNEYNRTIFTQKLSRTSASQSPLKWVSILLYFMSSLAQNGQNYSVITQITETFEVLQ